MTMTLTITRPIPGGTRRYLLGEDLAPVRIVDDYGPLRGTTEYTTPRETDVPADVRREAEEQIAAVDAPRRKRR